jgi:type I restriction-modification system DNA methylase subunit
MELQAAQQELDRVRSELSYQPTVISGNNLDLQNFKSGNSGFYVGAPPLLDAVPPNPARVTAVELEEKIENLKNALRCDPPEAAGVQNKLDRAEQQLKLLQREFALHQDTYYSRPDYTEDTAGKARLDAEQQQIQSLQSEVDRLRSELAALNLPQVAT